MNKTLKTIAWICLVLGLLGVAADAVALVYGRMLFEKRSELIAETREKIRERTGDWREHPCLDEGEDGGIVVDRECLGERGIDRGRIAQQRLNPGRGTMTPFSRTAGPFWILPLMLFAAGPVLVVIGSVILVVNREPESEKKKQEKVKPEKK